MQLKQGSTLQGGKYRIEKNLGQGGFGITYLAEQTITVKGDMGEIEATIKVAIKEFFMKDSCNRDINTSNVSIGSEGSREKVIRYKQKFIKEAQNLSKLRHNHIIKILETFEENGTAYYVMEHIAHGSLDDYIKENGAVSEAAALFYIRQIADALDYIHRQSMNHLDVKPANVLLRANHNIVLIDFGLAKQYDKEGDQTSTTPVGFSRGYAPSEQYLAGGMSQFSPTADIYSLGATLYKLVTGETPPDASYVHNEGLPELPAHLSSSTKQAISMAMQSRYKDRPQSISAFLDILGGDDGTDETTIIQKTQAAPKPKPKPKPEPKPEQETTSPAPKRNNIGIIVGVVAALLVVIGGYIFTSSPKDVEQPIEQVAEIKNVDTTLYSMVYVSGGTFRMGSVDSDADDDEQPIHSVTLSSYYIGRYEVTQQLWQDVMGSNPSYSKDTNKPVEQVSWYDCVEFCNALSRRARLDECYDISGNDVRLNIDRNGYRLPTEAEWEFAARGGNESRGYRYSGSNNADDVAWHAGNSGYKAHAVGLLNANELGIYDMSGNVTEWCHDLFADYNSSSQTNPTGPTSGSGRVIHGGYYSGSARFGRPSNRYNNSNPARGESISGVRLVRRP